LIPASDAAAARALVDAQDADAGLLVEAGADAATQTASATSSALGISVTVLEGASVTKNRAVNLMAQSFAWESSAIGIAMAAAPQSWSAIERLMAAAAGASADDSADASGTDTSAEGNASADSAFGGFTEKVVAGVNRSMLDYYSVAMIVMITFMSGAVGAATFFWTSRRDGTLRRICATPLRRERVFYGFLGYAIITSALQAAMVMIPAKLQLGVSFAERWQDNLLLVALFLMLGLAIAGVFGVIGLYVKTNPYAVMMVIVWPLLFLSGTFSREVRLDAPLPPALAQEAAFDLTVFGKPERALVFIAGCGLVLAVSTVVATLTLRKKEIVGL